MPEVKDFLSPSAMLPSATATTTDKESNVQCGRKPHYACKNTNKSCNATTAAGRGESTATSRLFLPRVCGRALPL
jgi:hypothetical protein